MKIRPWRAVLGLVLLLLSLFGGLFLVQGVCGPVWIDSSDPLTTPCLLGPLLVCAVLLSALLKWDIVDFGSTIVLAVIGAVLMACFESGDMKIIFSVTGLVSVIWIVGFLLGALISKGVGGTQRPTDG